jgi:hypothetical protein
VVANFRSSITTNATIEDHEQRFNSAPILLEAHILTTISMAKSSAVELLSVEDLPSAVVTACPSIIRFLDNSTLLRVHVNAPAFTGQLLRS